LWKVVILKSAQKELDKLPKDVFKRVINKLNQLEDSPYLRGCKKLIGLENSYRMRVGSWRVFYGISEREMEIAVFAVRHRKEAYRFS